MTTRVITYLPVFSAVVIITGVVIKNSDERLFHTAQGSGEWSVQEFFVDKRNGDDDDDDVDENDDRYICVCRSNPTVVDHIVVDGRPYTCIVLRPLITDDGAL